MSENSVRLEVARQQLIERAGGALTVEDAAELLGTTAGDVRARIRQGTLLAYPTNFGDRLPQAQFEGGDVLPGLGQVLDAMWITDEWMRFQLLLDPDVIGPLRAGRTQEAVHAVRSYLPRDEG